ncbi:DUF2306 domain-containing protein [Chryseobacterium gregarium]|uniref:DUF2306 domain-containing protein n=1 Tax=Chryseobacterium gregarium TaxID=456299 RepID=UPI000410E964|nr:DUF2306 domain-containing protein [Chryseobacterium gregarium]
MRKFLFVIICIFALLIGTYPLIYVFLDHKHTFLSTKIPEVAHNTIWRGAFLSHIILGGVALFIGWRQFGSRFREKNPATHRVIGKIYVFSVIISSIAGMYLGIYANGGLISSLGFICLGGVWLYSTVSGILYIRKGNIQKHQCLMIYSYACTFAAVTLRLWFPLLKSITGNPEGSYLIVAWLCWIPNLFVAYLISKYKVPV